MVLLIWCSAVVVDLCCLNPCWCSGSVMLFVMCGRMIFSSVLAMGERSAMGLYEEPIAESFPGLGMGMIFASFHMVGMVLVLSEVLKMFVRNVIAWWPRCFRCFMLMLSGPVELLFRAFWMALSVSTVVIGVGVVWSFCVFLSICLLFASVW